MKFFSILSIFFVSSCTLAQGKTDSLNAPILPFQLITVQEYKALLDLSNGSPTITHTRLVNSGSEAIQSIVNNIASGLIAPINLPTSMPFHNPMQIPVGEKIQGYPLCVIQSNGLLSQNRRSYDAMTDSANNYGSFSINFFHPGTVDVNYDEDIAIDDEDPDVPRPSKNQGSDRHSVTSGYSSINENQNTHEVATPVVNCVVVLKQPHSRPSATISTTTYRPPTRPSSRPQYYPQNPQQPQRPQHPQLQYPGYIPTYPQIPPRVPQLPNSPYQIVPLPFPPYLGLLGPSISPSSQNNAYMTLGSLGSSTGSGGPMQHNWPLLPGSLQTSSSLNVQGTQNSHPQLPWPYLLLSQQSQQNSGISNSQSPTYLPGAFFTANIDGSLATPNNNLFHPYSYSFLNSLGLISHDQQPNNRKDTSAEESRSASYDSAPDFKEVQSDRTESDASETIEPKEKKQSVRSRPNNRTSAEALN